jgi:uncharacterized protein (UPF0332 family)
MKPEDQEAYVQYRLKRAEGSVRETEDMLRLGHTMAAVNRLYYACFYAVDALLQYHTIQNATTHSGVRRMFGKHFVNSGKIPQNMGRFYSNLFNLRHKGDYDAFVEFEPAMVEDMLITGKEFIRQIEGLIGKP